MKNTPAKSTKKARSSAAHGSGARGNFYRGIEWMACWLLDNAEGETISEEQLRSWAAKAWEAHLKRPNDQALPQ